MKLDLVRDLLDQQLVDRSGTKIGRVDGLVIEVREDGPPLVDHIQVGAVVLARRLGPRTERLVRWVRSRFVKDDKPPIEIRWPLVAEINQHHIKLSISAETHPVNNAEEWLRENLLKKIPGSKR